MKLAYDVLSKLESRRKEIAVLNQPLYPDPTGTMLYICPRCGEATYASWGDCRECRFPYHHGEDDD